jgi:hypothetical protein
VKVYDAAFNTFVGDWTDNSIALGSTTTKPAKERGQYFNGTNGVMTFAAFTLHFRFSAAFIIRLDDLAADYTVFSKDRNAFPNGLVARMYIK